MKRLIFLGLLAFGCSSAPETTTTIKPVETVPAPIPEVKPDDQTHKAPSKPSSARIYTLSSLEKAKLKTPKQTIDVYVMDDESKRQEGMMFLSDDEVKDDEGFLFIFANEQPQSFWMQNTILPLDIVYISAKGKVVSIAKGKSYDETSLPSKGPAQFVLELKQGESVKLGLKEVLPSICRT